MFLEFITGKDFLTNVAAGGVFFALEVTLLVGLLPWVLEKRREARWTTSRQGLIIELHKGLAAYASVAKGALAALEKNGDVRGIDSVATVRNNIAFIVQTYSAALNPLLMERCVYVLHRSNHIEQGLEGLVARRGKGYGGMAGESFKECGMVLFELTKMFGVYASPDIEEINREFQAAVSEIQKLTNQP